MTTSGNIETGSNTEQTIPEKNGFHPVNEKAVKRFKIIEDIKDLKVGDRITWVKYDEGYNGRCHYYDGVISGFNDGGEAVWSSKSGYTNDCVSGILFRKGGIYGMAIPVDKIADTKLAREIHRDNIEKIENGEIYLKELK